MSAFTRTYTTTLDLPTPAGSALAEYAELFSRAVRTSYAAQERGHAAAHREGEALSTQAERKAGLAEQFGLTSRQAYSALVEAQGHRDGLLALNKLELLEVEDRLTKHRGRAARARATLAEHRRGKTLRLGPARSQQLRESLFRAQTQAAKLKARLKVLRSNLAAKSTSLTFGTKKALRQRNALALALADSAPLAGDTPAEAARKARLRAQLNSELQAWQAAWDLKRAGQFLVVGSKDETGGCSGCIATAEEDGTFTLSVKLPSALGGERVVLDGIQFKYGAAQLRHALAQQQLRAASRKQVHSAAKAAAASAPALEEGGAQSKLKVSQRAIEGGLAVTWRFMRQADGRWALAFTTAVAAHPQVTDRAKGAIGVDLNAGFLTVAETDRCGNIISSRNVITPDVGLSANQRLARQGEAVKHVIAQCLATGKPLVLEELDFAKKKRSLASRTPGAKRKLSALAYSALHDLFSARALDCGVEVVNIDPAYTSTQGWLRYAAQRGWSAHQAAAGVIARRGQGYSEKAPVSGTLRVSVGGLAVERPIPEEIGRSDAACRWPALHRILQQAIASHYRVQRRAGQPQSARPAGASVVPGETPGLKRGSPSPASA